MQQCYFEYVNLLVLLSQRFEYMVYVHPGNNLDLLLDINYFAYLEANIDLHTIYVG